MGRAIRSMVIVTLAVLVAGAVVPASAGAAAVAKPLDACTVLTQAELQEIVGSPVSSPNPSASDALSCGFEYGDGLGGARGGVLVLQLWKGKLGKNIYRAAKKTDEPVGDVYWNAKTGIATGREDRVTINASLTGPGDHRDVAVMLVEAVAAEL